MKSRRMKLILTQSPIHSDICKNFIKEKKSNYKKE